MKVEIPADVLRHVYSAMVKAVPYCKHAAAQATLRVWADTLKGYLPETLEAEKQDRGFN